VAGLAADTPAESSSSRRVAQVVKGRVAGTRVASWFSRLAARAARESPVELAGAADLAEGIPAGSSSIPGARAARRRD